MGRRLLVVLILGRIEWVVDGGDGTITQIVGVAAPVVTPASVAVQNNALDQRP